MSSDLDELTPRREAKATQDQAGEGFTAAGRIGGGVSSDLDRCQIA
jgi:hypothetical protein